MTTKMPKNVQPFASIKELLGVFEDHKLKVVNA